MEKLPRERRLRGRERIGQLFGEGAGAASGVVLAKALPNADGTVRIAAVAGKKMGCAVLRNRMRRRLRAAFRTRQADLPGGHDFALVARRGILEVSWRDLVRDVEKAMRRAAAGGGHPFWPAPVPAPKIAPLRRPLSWLAVGAIKCYQRSLSRLWPNVCRYHPSCSNYAVHAITKRGLVAGCFLAAWRILRCNPLSRGGYDPPPGYEEVLRELSRDAGA